MKQSIEKIPGVLDHDMARYVSISGIKISPEAPRSEMTHSAFLTTFVSSIIQTPVISLLQHAEHLPFGGHKPRMEKHPFDWEKGI